MNPSIQFKTTVPPVGNSTNPSPLRLGLTLITLVFGCFALSPTVRAVTPPPDGGYSGGNTAEGTQALLSLTSGTHNTAVGARALYSDTTSYDNTAVGWRALYTNTNAPVPILNGPGGWNTAIGAETLYDNNGYNNTAVGWRALRLNTTGSNNIALGWGAGYALTTGDYNIDIGNGGVSDEANTIRIGTQGTQTATFIAGISGATVPTGVAVVIDSTTGQLGISATSSARFKNDIKPMDKASEAVLALKPVTFRYKQEIDPKGIRQFGLVAEEVEKVNPALVTRDANGKVYTVRYDAVNAMLLNEFIKEHKKVEEQQSKIDNQQASIAELKATVAQQAKGMDVLTAQLKEQAAQIQKVSAQFEASKTTPQMVNNDQ